MKCPCESGKEYQTCCEPYHKGEPAPTPETLMRSRYSAYALGLVPYIIETAMEKPRSEDVEAFCKATKLEGLEIISVEPSHVTFRAKLSQGGRDASFTERSYFEQVDGRWLYASGTILP